MCVIDPGLCLIDNIRSRLQITEAIRRYGVSDTTTALFVIRVTSPELTDVEAKMNAVVLGTLSPLISLERLTEWSSIKKVCKHTLGLTKGLTRIPSVS